MPFKLISPYQPTGDQPAAIKKLLAGLKKKYTHQTLMGATGTGKTFTMAKVIESINKPTLVIAHNKTLAAQLYEEFKSLFPKNAVHYFVSFYDYYQPEAYIPHTDTYIDKDMKINEEIDALRHKSVHSLMTRKDVIVVASVSCIYNLGSPVTYKKLIFNIHQGMAMSRRELLKRLLNLQYERNDFSFKPGQFRIRADFIDIWSVAEDKIFRLKLKNDQIVEVHEASSIFKKFHKQGSITIFSAKFWLTEKEKLAKAILNIKAELQARLKELKKKKKLLEAEKLRRRTEYDIALLEEVGWCPGIENYSSHLEFRPKGQPPYTLIDFFPKDYLLFVDESHKTLSQIKGMHEGDHSRKTTLVDYGFRLPSAIDNRPLKYAEFEKRINQVIYSSATPGQYEHNHSEQVVQQLIRPTFLLDPEIEVRPTADQIENFITEIEKTVALNRRVLITTLTKRLAEALSDFLKERKIKATYLHSEIDTLKRPKILNELRQGKYDVLVGINLLREGLDLPEVALIGIFDADKESFLRDQTSLIQIIGRTARHPQGKVIMYADRMTRSMKAAIDETNRRRKIQEEYNIKHHKTPQQVVKEIKETLGPKDEENEETSKMPADEFKKEYLRELKNKMDLALRNLQFDKAALIRQQIEKVKNS